MPESIRAYNFIEPARFYSTLSETARLTFDNPRRPSLEEIQELKRTLGELDAAARLELAFETPPLSISAAAWAGVTLYRVCQFYVYRDIGAEVVLDTLFGRCRAAMGSERQHLYHYDRDSISVL